MISVIIPVYNDQANLDRCLEALGNQSISASEFEVIVVDNASEPAMAINGNHHTAIRLIVCGKPGSYAARNAGIKASQGEVLAFLDADCIPDTNWLENGVGALQVESTNRLVGGEVALTQTEHPTAIELYQCLAGFGQKYNIQNKSFSATANLFIKAMDADTVGEFNEELLSGGDLDWSWRAKDKGLELIYAPDVLVTTPPRRSFKSAIKQARRVAGGRLWFKNNFSDKIGSKNISTTSRRTSLESIFWILSQTDIPAVDRIRVLFVAIVIKLAQILETVRLKLGGNPERL